MSTTRNRIKTGQVVVGASPVKIPASPLPDGNQEGILVKAFGSSDVAANTVPVFIGDAQVTINSGFSLGPGESTTVPIFGDELYAVASAASQNVCWMLA